MTRILITGAGGNVGRALLAGLSGHEVLATDLHPIAGVAFERVDVTGDDAARVIGAFKPEVVVHLASIVTPPKGSTRDFEWRVVVQGSRNVMQACVAAGVRLMGITRITRYLCVKLTLFGAMWNSRIPTINGRSKRCWPRRAAIIRGWSKLCCA